MTSQPLTPPSDLSQPSRRIQAAHETPVSHATSSSVDDNTAAGMALSQEDSMYITPAASPAANHLEVVEDKIEDDGIKQSWQVRGGETAPACQLSPAASEDTIRDEKADSPLSGLGINDEHNDRMDVDRRSTPMFQHESHRASPDRTSPFHDELLPRGLSKVDLSLNRTSQVPGWDFTDKKPIMKSPSSLFQPYSKYVGTQQSDRQTYNVEVTILTIDMEQCSMSGYLLIRGLTPEHPMLQTFFTGEIVGGPNQRYTFKTMDPAWGATYKDDLQHWLRFPAWRHLTSHAKRNMSFEFPLDQEPWFSQEHIFMRWKEHFLVPDHKQSSIQGASFEGFYYICLNQLKGKISGVYFHSKSEKYQQLELTHVTKKGLGVFGVSPLIELR